jgi:hypothetical protein
MPFFTVWGMVGRFFSLPPHELYNLIVICSLTVLGIALYKSARDRGWESWQSVLVGAVPWFSDLLFYRHYAFPQQALALSLVLWFILKGQSRSKVDFGLGVIGAVSHLSAAVLFITYMLLLPVRYQKVGWFIGFLSGISYFLYTSRLIINQSGSYEITMLAPALWQACIFADCSRQEWFEVVFFIFLFLIMAILMVRLKFQVKLELKVLLVLTFLCLLPIWSRAGHMLYRLGLTANWLIVASAVLMTREKPKTSGLMLVAFVLGVFCLTSKEYTEAGLPYELLREKQPALRRWMANPAIIQATHGDNFRLRYAWLSSYNSNSTNFYSPVPPERGEVVVSRFKPPFKSCKDSIEIQPDDLCFRLSNDWYLLKKSSN